MPVIGATIQAHCRFIRTKSILVWWTRRAASHKTETTREGPSSAMSEDAERDTMSRRADRKTSTSIPGIKTAVPAIMSIRDAAHVAEDL